MPRLDTERQKALEPKRIETAIKEIENLGITVWGIYDTHIKFLFKDETVTYFAYSG